MKSYMMMYGNDLLIRSFSNNKFMMQLLLNLVNPLNNFITTGKKDKDVLNTENFLEFFENVLKVLESHSWTLLKILFKLLYEKINEIFTVDANTKYHPIFTLLFFNFLISPRIQEIYGISPVKYEVVRVINRIFRVRNFID
jgi:hypothetical protein